MPASMFRHEASSAGRRPRQPPSGETSSAPGRPETPRHRVREKRILVRRPRGRSTVGEAAFSPAWTPGSSRPAGDRPPLPPDLTPPRAARRVSRSAAPWWPALLLARDDPAWTTPSSPCPILILSILALALASRVRFPVHEGFTVPIVLASRPRLFLTPPPLVAPLTALALTRSRSCPYVARGTGPAVAAPVRCRELVVRRRARSWCWPSRTSTDAQTIDRARPAGGPRPPSPQPTSGASPLRERIVGGATLREQMTDVAWVYKVAVDAALAPVGFLAAALISPDPHYSVLLLLPLLAPAPSLRDRTAPALREHLRAERGVPRHRAGARPTSSRPTTPTPASTARTSSSSRSPLRDALGLDRRASARNAEFGALLHDVGKVAHPEGDHQQGRPARRRRVGRDPQAPTRSRATGCSIRSVGSSAGRLGGARARTSAGTAPATRTAWRARRSRSRRASSRAATPTAR